MRIFALGLFLATPALAFEPGTYGPPFEGRVHLTSCQLDGSEGAGCTLAVPGGFFSVWADADTDTALMDKLGALPFGTALDVTGDISGEGDGIGRELVLNSAAPVADDPVASVMDQLRGVWDADAAPGYSLQIDGVDWFEDGPDEDSHAFVASYDTTCADGTKVDGVAVWLQERVEDGLEKGPCYGVEFDEGGALVLINQGNGRSYGYTRSESTE